MNIFEIQQSKQDKEFVMKNGSLEFEVFADILKTADDIPYIGSLFKLSKVAVNYMDYRFVRKLYFFLVESENIEPERKEKFLNSLDEKDYKRINAMMTHLLYSAEEDGKATLMGKIYRSRLLGEIDDEKHHHDDQSNDEIGRDEYTQVSVLQRIELSVAQRGSLGAAHRIELGLYEVHCDEHAND